MEEKMSEWPSNQEWAKKGWPKTAEDIWTLIEMGVWEYEKNWNLIQYEIAKELYETVKLIIPYAKDQANSEHNDCAPCREIANNDVRKAVAAIHNYEKEVIKRGSK